MVFHPAKRGREAAQPMQPIVDPAGWCPADLAANEDWIYTLTEMDIAEVKAATTSLQRLLSSMGWRRFTSPAFVVAPDFCSVTKSWQRFGILQSLRCRPLFNERKDCA